MCIRDFVKKWLYKVTTGFFAATTVLFVVLYLTKVGDTTQVQALRLDVYLVKLRQHRYNCHFSLAMTTSSCI